MHILFILLWVACSSLAHAEEPINFPRSSYISLAAKKIKTVIDGNLLETDDGNFIRLDGVRIPNQYDPNTISPYAVNAKKLLSEQFEEKNATIYIPQQARKDMAKNRLGQIEAQLLTPEGVWAQKLLLENGLAYAYPSDNTQAAYPFLLKAESIARISKIGLWSTEEHKILSPETVKQNSYTMQIVEGNIISVATVRDNMYLNFGKDWKTDFTIMLPSSVRKSMSKSGLNPTLWQGKKVRVRGFVEDYNGPMIKLSFAEQLEVLD